jgi:hypothetical protein
MSDRTPERVLRMRALAAQLRTHATETTLEVFQRRFEAVAAELEQRADIEGRFYFLPRRLEVSRAPDKGSGRGYGR